MTTVAPPGSRQAHREASERDKHTRRFLLRLSLANWGIAVVAWTISAFLGITSPASIIIYSVLFVIGLIAVVVALLTFVLEKFAHTPAEVTAADAEVGEDEGGEDETAATAAVAPAKTEPPAKDEPPVKDEPAAKREPAARTEPFAPQSGAKAGTARTRAPKPEAPKTETTKPEPRAAADESAGAKGDAAPKGDAGAKGGSPASPTG